MYSLSGGLVRDSLVAGSSSPEYSSTPSLPEELFRSMQGRLFASARKRQVTFHPADGFLPGCAMANLVVCCRDPCGSCGAAESDLERGGSDECRGEGPSICVSVILACASEAESVTQEDPASISDEDEGRPSTTNSPLSTTPSRRLSEPCRRERTRGERLSAPRGSRRQSTPRGFADRTALRPSAGPGDAARDPSRHRSTRPAAGQLRRSLISLIRGSRSR
jgi:hypothetical protein